MPRNNRVPFTWEEWKRWRDETRELENDIRERSIHAGVAFGQLAEDRGRRIARDLEAYRDFVGKLAFNKIADANQLEMFWGTPNAV